MAKQVDVVIAAYGQSLMTIRAIESLKSQSRLSSVVLIDDSSPPEESETLEHIQGVRYFKNQGNSGWIKSIDRGVKKTDAPYVMTMNSDVELFPHALEFMANNLDDGAAVCGCLLLYPQNHPHPPFKGRVQHAGVMYAFDGFPTHVCSGFHPDDPAVRTWRSINSVTGAAMMVRREIWDKIGGFDAKFGNGVFEDCDFCLSVKKIGLDVIYEPKALGWHFEHMSQSQGSSWFSTQNVQNNLGLLFLKHGQPKCDSHLFFKTR